MPIYLHTETVSVVPWIHSAAAAVRHIGTETDPLGGRGGEDTHYEGQDVQGPIHGSDSVSGSTDESNFRSSQACLAWFAERCTYQGTVDVLMRDVSVDVRCHGSRTGKMAGTPVHVRLALGGVQA